MALSSNEIFQQIEDKQLRLVELPQGTYYLSEQGKVYSLNKQLPRVIDPARCNSGEYSVVLYVPHIKTYNLAALMLQTFKRAGQKGELPCYKDKNPSNFAIGNLFWGSASDRREWVNEQSLNRSKQLQEEVSEDLQERDIQTINYYCNKPFLLDLFGFMTHLNRLILGKDISVPDANKVRRGISEITELTSVNLLKFDRLENIFEQDFEDHTITQLYEEYRLVLTKSRKAYCNL